MKPDPSYIKIMPPFELYPSCQVAEMQEWLTEQGAMGLTLRIVRGRYYFFQQGRPAEMIYRIEPVISKKGGNASRIGAWKDAGFSVARTRPFNIFYALSSKKITDLHSSRQSFSRLYNDLAGIPGVSALLFAFAFCLFLTAAVLSFSSKASSAYFPGWVCLFLGLEQIVFFLFWGKVYLRIRNISKQLNHGQEIGRRYEISRTPVIVLTTVLLAIIIILLLVNLNN